MTYWIFLFSTSIQRKLHQLEEEQQQHWQPRQQWHLDYWLDDWVDQKDWPRRNHLKLIEQFIIHCLQYILVKYHSLIHIFNTSSLRPLWVTTADHMCTSLPLPASSSVTTTLCTSYFIHESSLGFPCFPPAPSLIFCPVYPVPPLLHMSYLSLASLTLYPNFLPELLLWCTVSVSNFGHFQFKSLHLHLCLMSFCQCHCLWVS